MISLEISRQTFDQSDAKWKPTATFSVASSRASGSLLVFTSTSPSFLEIVSLLWQDIAITFGFLTLKRNSPSKIKDKKRKNLGQNQPLLFLKCLYTPKTVRFVSELRICFVVHPQNWRKIALKNQQINTIPCSSQIKPLIWTNVMTSPQLSC